MAQADHPHAGRDAPPRWSQALRALREARGITQEGWAAQLGYGRATIRRWEAGTTVPSAEAEAAIIALCGEKRLYRAFTDGPLAGVRVSPEWIADLLAAARLGTDASGTESRPVALACPPVRYALSGNVAVAYQVFGDGPIDLVVTPGAVSHRELDWEHPGAVDLYGRLARFARVAVYDKRGTGMSDRVSTGTLEERMDDIRAVMDAAGMQRAALLGVSEGGPLSMIFAATYPERIAALILYGTYEHVAMELSPEESRLHLERLRGTWGAPNSGYLERFGPSVAGDPDAQQWWGRYLRMSASPGAVATLNRMNARIDVRPYLSTLDVRTLVLHRAGDRVVDIGEGLTLAERIPNAHFMALAGDDHLPWIGDVAGFAGAVETFLSGTCPFAETDHTLATVLAAMPASPTRDVRTLEDQRQLARREVLRWRGTVMPTEHHGVLAIFTSPSRAIHCASAIRNATRASGAGFRLGIHVGEVALVGGRAAGPVVEAGERLALEADPGEVLASELVADLATGTDVSFTPRPGSREPGDPRALIVEG